MSDAIQEFMKQIKEYSDGALVDYSMYEAALSCESLNGFDTLANRIIDELGKRKLPLDKPVRDRKTIKVFFEKWKNPLEMIRVSRNIFKYGAGKNAAPIPEELKKILDPQRGSKVYYVDGYFSMLQAKNGFLAEESEEGTSENESEAVESVTVTETKRKRKALPNKRLCWTNEILPPFYHWSEDGELIFQPKLGTPTMVYPGKIYIKRLLFAGREPNADNKAEIRFDCDGKEMIQIMPLNDLYNAAKLKDLAVKGAMVYDYNAHALAHYFFEYMKEFRQIIERGYTTRQIGWLTHEFDNFVPYFSEDIYENHDYEFLYKSILRSEGTYKKWAALLKPFRNSVHIPLRIILATSFASVLAEPLIHQPFFLYIQGRSQIAKTPALMIVASVWADPTKQYGYIQDLAGSDEGIELGAQFYGSLPYCLNESQNRVAQKKEPSIDKLVYLLGDGTPKTRGKGNGGIREQSGWCNAIILTGEEELTKNSQKLGVRMRVFDLTATESIISSDDEETEALIEAIEHQYNTAGEEFVRRLINGGLEKAKEIYNTFRKAIPSNVERRQNHIAAAILTADALAAEWIFRDDIVLGIDDVLPYLKVRPDEPEEIDFAEVQQAVYEWIRGEIGVDCKGESDKGRLIGSKMFAFYKSETLAGIVKEAGCELGRYLEWAKANGILATKEGDGYTRNVAHKKGTPEHSNRLYVINLPVNA